MSERDFGDDYDDYEDRDCWNCGGEGLVADCFDGFCVNAEDGCSLCIRRCSICRHAPRNEQLDQVLVDALAKYGDGGG